MTMKLSAYIVTLVFDDRRAFTEACVSHAPETASVGVTLQAVKRMDPPPGDIVGVSVVEIQPAFMRAALQAIESGKPSGEVVSLVRQDEPDHALGPAEPVPDMPAYRGHRWEYIPGRAGAQRCNKCGYGWLNAPRNCPADDADLSA